MLGNLINAVIGNIGNDDPEIGGGGQINSVDPHTIPGDNPAFGEAF